MPHHRVFRASSISVASLSMAQLSLLILAAGFPGVARADSKKFVVHARGSAFEVAAAIAAESANPTIAKMPVEVAGLLTEDSALPNRAPALSGDSSRAPIYTYVAATSATSDETPLAYGALADDNGLPQSAHDGSADPQFATMFYGSEGFYFYPAAPGVVSSTGFDPTNSGVGHPAPGDSSFAGVPGAVHNGVARRIKSRFRILSDEPAPVPEPSSLLLVGCGVFAVGLKRKSHSAK